MKTPYRWGESHLDFW